ncbi:MAG: hypothetical protein HWD58_06790 [Bacteroidota bacterium]|nr:MAG: hypothetical protein HWD58_06790 [Bacteroidota bacterium]
MCDEDTEGSLGFFNRCNIPDAQQPVLFKSKSFWNVSLGIILPGHELNDHRGAKRLPV